VSVNGVKINNIVDLARALHAAAAGPAAAMLRLEFADAKVIVLPVAAAQKATADVCRVHAIAAPMSDDLVRALGGGAAAGGGARWWEGGWGAEEGGA
jgi:hypothetical protein